MKQKMFKLGLIISLTILSMTGHTQMGQAEVTSEKDPITNKENTSFKVKVQAAGESSFRILVENPIGKKLSISISDKAGNILFDATTSEKNYACKYDFSNVEDGKYIINISNRKEKFEKEVELNTITIESRNISSK